MVDVMQLSEAGDIASLEVAGITYYPASEVARVAGVSRQSLWRWRQEGKVPPGRRYRDRQILFTARELEQVLSYANRIEPTEPASTLETESMEQSLEALFRTEDEEPKEEGSE